MADELPKKIRRHLQRLPNKSFTVAPGDVVGGMIYVMDKPLGIEEGMVGMSIDSPGYRAHLIDTMTLLDEHRLNKTPPFETDNPALQQKFNHLIKDEHFNFSAFDLTQKNIILDLMIYHPNIQNYLDSLNKEEKTSVLEFKDKHLNIDLEERLHKKHPVSLVDNIKKIFTKRMHEIKRVSYTNEGMGGLLFQDYKEKCGIKENEHFASHIKKLIFANHSEPINPIFMVKQDGKLSFFNGTGPGFSKILKTSTGKKLQENFSIPKLFTIVLPLYTLAQLGVRRVGYLLKNKPTHVNSDAITETMATKLAGIRGFDVQEIETLEGTYKDNSTKITTLVTWTPDCQDLSSKNKVMGNQSSLDGLIVAQTQDGEALKRTNDGALLYRKEVNDPETGKLLGYEYYKNDQTDPITSENKEDYQAITEAYQQACYFTEDRIDGIGESLITLIAQGDRDALGKKGQNKAIVPKENGRYDFFGIDFGKAYANESNPLLASLEDDFSFISPDSKIGDAYFSNYSALYDNPLREKMKGIYLLSALRGELTDIKKEAIAKEYEVTDSKFADKLRNMKEVDKDLKLINDEIAKYQTQKESNPKAAQEFQIYIDKLEKIKRTVIKTDTVILEKFSERSQLMPSQLDVLETMEKLCAKKAHVIKKDRKNVILRKHLWVAREDRMPWQFDKNNTLVCHIEDIEDAHHVQEKFNQLVDLLKNKEADPALIESLQSYQFHTGENTLPEVDVSLFNTHVNEDSVAEIHNIKEYLPQTQRNQLSEIRDSINHQSKINQQNKTREAPVVEPTPQSPLENSPEKTKENTTSLEFNTTSQPTQKATEKRAKAWTVANPKTTTRSMADVAQHELDNFKNLDAYMSQFKDFHHIEKVEKIKSGAYQQFDTRVITFSNPKEPDVSSTVYAQKMSNTLNYSTPLDSNESQFELAAQEICRLAVCSKSSNAIYLPDTLSNREQDTVRKAFDAAVTEAVQQGKLDKENVPQLLTKDKSEPSKIAKPH